MHLANLKSLHNAMTQRGFTRVQFKIEIASRQITAVFIAEGSPYLMGLLIDNTMIVVPVLAGYQINPVLAYQDYARLSAAMGKNHKAGDTFYSGAFFKELDAKTPTESATGMFVAPWLALHVYPNVDEPKKHHFMGFQKNNFDSPSDHNLEKTKFLLGEEAYKICKTHGLSSRWTDDSNKAVKVVPELAKLRVAYAHANVVIAPAVKPKPFKEPSYVSKLAILCGVAGTGKSTLSREVQRRNPKMVILDLDVVTAPLVTQLLMQAGVCLDELPAHEELYHKIVNAQYAALLALAHDLLSQGHYPLCVGSFNQSLENPDLLIALSNDLKNTGVELKLAVLTTSEEEAKRRLEQRKDHWDRLRLANWESVKHEYKTYSLPVSLNACTVDTTDYSRPQVVEKLSEFFKN